MPNGMTNAMASKEVISLLQDMATQYESHFQTRQGEHLDAFDQKIRHSIQGDPDRARLLSLVESRIHFPLQVIFPLEEFLEERFSYLSSGSFGSALLYECGRRRCKQVVKIINCQPSSLYYKQEIKTGMRYKDIHREVTCMSVLMSLARGVRITEEGPAHRHGTERPEEDSSANPTKALCSVRQYKAGSFPKLNALYLCDPAQALLIFESFFSNSSGDVSTYDAFEKAVLVMEHCGKNLHRQLAEMRFVGRQAVSVAKQVILGLLVAERAFGFEHRDLHTGNLMVKSTKMSFVVFLAGDARYSVPSHGVQAKIIDFTYSRLQTRPQGEILFKDLSGLFKSTDLSNNDARPFDGYRDMFEARGGAAVGWEHFSPASNLAWVRHFLNEMCQAIPKTRATVLAKEELTAKRRARFQTQADSVGAYFNKMLQISTHCRTMEQFVQQLLNDDINQPSMVPIKVQPLQ